ncbi:MAG: tRNA-Thr(GGU) m(6)t(6)A37 methyltransferase TsaA [Myxococcota bacterium]|jgi:tRNA-Thr(GGU) m(6)t(6)A37 methyltransferase TsaA
MTISLTPIATVTSPRAAHLDDFWRDVSAVITLSESLDAAAFAGIEAFSHLEVIFFMDRVAPEKIHRGARRPRNNPDWPEVGIFAQRARSRPNRLGLSRCRLLRAEGRTLWVADLDALDGTAILDIKPLMVECLPADPIRQPDWSGELMANYYRPTSEDHRQ